MKAPLFYHLRHSFLSYFAFLGIHPIEWIAAAGASGMIAFCSTSPIRAIPFSFGCGAAVLLLFVLLRHACERLATIDQAPPDAEVATLTALLTPVAKHFGFASAMLITTLLIVIS